MSKLFAPEEVAASTRLRFLGAALLLHYFLTFQFWFPRSGLSTLGESLGNFVPMWPVESFPELGLLSDPVTRSLMRLLGLAAVAGMFGFFSSSRCLWPMQVLALEFLAKLFFYLHDLRLAANFHHVHLILSLLFLFSTRKLFFFRVGLWLTYWLAALPKLTPSWLYGEYFRSVPPGLPFFPRWDWLIVALSLYVLFMELVGPFCWLTRSRWLHRWMLASLLFFHLYSGLIVGYWYTTLMLPLVLGALLGMQEPMQSGYRLERRHLALWLYVLLQLGGGFYNFAIPGDVRLTAEGRYLGLFMFDANRRVQAELEVEKAGKRFRFEIEFGWPRREVLDWTTRIRATARYPGRPPERWRDLRRPLSDDGVVILNPLVFQQSSSRMFGDPYLYYQWARSLQRRYAPDRIGIRMVQQLDGYPEEVVLLDIPDFAATAPRYHPFRHNEWIRLPGPEAPRTYRWP